MKNFTFLLSFILIALSAKCQNLESYYYDLTFEDTLEFQHLRIDSVSNHNNLWQIGSPDKTSFTYANSIPNVIVTDTVTSYPINDTSSFTIVNLANLGFVYQYYVSLSGYYNVNSDTLVDNGTIEFSPDNGTTWIDLVNDVSYSSQIQWATPKPILSGNSYGWQYFQVNFQDLAPVFNIQFGDTVLYRFTFISDGIQTNKDGLMFDDFLFQDWFEGIDEIQNDDLISISPNPSANDLRIVSKIKTEIPSIQIINSTGQVLYNNPNFKGEIIDTRDFSNGIYFLKYSTSTDISIKKFVVQH